MKKWREPRREAVEKIPAKSWVGWRIIDLLCERHVSFAGGVFGDAWAYGVRTQDGKAANLRAHFTSLVKSRGRFAICRVHLRSSPAPTLVEFICDLNQCRRRKQKSSVGLRQPLDIPSTEDGAVV